MSSITNEKNYTLGENDKEQTRLSLQSKLYGNKNYIDVAETDKVCEVGCGSGANLYIAEKLEKGQYIGIDVQ